LFELLLVDKVPLMEDGFHDVVFSSLSISDNQSEICLGKNFREGFRFKTASALLGIGWSENIQAS
jgi:hypothetical protein